MFFFHISYTKTSTYTQEQNFTHPLNKILHNNNEPIFMNSQENGDAQTLTKIYM